jgi:dienelactone hydrolase
MVRLAALNPLIGASLCCLILAVALALPKNAPAAPAPEPVEISHDGLKLKGFLYRPAGNGPFAAVIALHACDGLAGRRTPFARRYRDWGERLATAGFVALFPDSFGARNLGPQCNAGQRTLRSGRERAVDAEAARKWLQQQPYVAPDRVSLMGWANGGVAALWAIRPRPGKKDNNPDFRSVIAFYPGCRRLRDTAWSARMPTLILIGAKDDWVSAGACQQMVAGARGRSAQASITVYPGAYHDFDRPELPLQQRNGVLINGSAGRVHIGTDPQARSDALRRVAEWLAR